MRGIDVTAPDSQGKAGEGGGLPDGAKLLVFPGLPQKMPPNLVFRVKKNNFAIAFHSLICYNSMAKGASGVPPIWVYY